MVWEAVLSEFAKSKDLPGFFERDDNDATQLFVEFFTMKDQFIANFKNDTPEERSKLRGLLTDFFKKI